MSKSRARQTILELIEQIPPLTRGEAPSTVTSG
jgi:hypothetical protein